MSVHQANFPARRSSAPPTVTDPVPAPDPIPTLTLAAGETPVRVVLCGLGRHAEKAHLPAVERLRKAGRAVEIVAIVDAAPAREDVTARAARHGLDAELAFFEPFDGHLAAGDAITFDRLIRRHEANAVIVATPPEAHFGFAMQGLRQGVNVFLDKPVTARPNAVSDLAQACGILDDMLALVEAYGQARQRGDQVCVTVGCQRRRDPLMERAAEHVQDIAERTGCPVTAISASHGDGQFRLPHELVDIRYHGFDRGCGKLSHSGYHFLDAVYRLLSAGWRAWSRPDAARVLASFVQPQALLHHIPRERYREIFGPEFDAACHYTDDEIAAVGPGMGEIDATLLVEFLRSEDTVAQAVISLFHNSVSGRSWLRPRQDLYKGMGRLKHEAWVIQSGPFQTITLETRQTDDIHDRAGPKDHALGGPNHREMRIFRNAGALGGGPRLEVVAAHELPGFDPKRLVGEQAKAAALGEFFDFAQGRIGHAELRSDLTDHLIPTSLMSAAYCSHISRQRGQAGFVPVRL